MIKTHETATHDYYLDYFEGKPVRILRHKQTGEISFDLNSLAACLGYESAEAMMSDDRVLDCINEHTRQTGKSPLQKL